MLLVIASTLFWLNGLMVGVIVADWIAGKLDRISDDEGWGG